MLSTKDPVATEALWVSLCMSCSWSQASGDSSTGGSGLSQGALLAAVIVPIIIASALLGIALACFLCRRFNKQPDSASKDIDDPGKGPMLPQFLAGACFGHKHSNGPDSGAGSSGHARSGKDSAAGTPVVVAVRDGTVSFVEREASGTSGGADGAPIEQQKSVSSMSNSMSRSRAQSGFNDDIAQVCAQEDCAAVCTIDIKCCVHAGSCTLVADWNGPDVWQCWNGCGCARACMCASAFLLKADSALMLVAGAGLLQACKALVTKKNVGRDDELVLESVLGEGSYGKVRTLSQAVQPASGSTSAALCWRWPGA